MRTILFDRSRSTTDWDCSRKRYWQYEHDGRGIVPNVTAIALYMGQVLHDGLAAIAHGEKDKNLDIDIIATTAFKQLFEALSADNDSFAGVQYANEQAALIEGLLRAFYKGAWPTLMATYPEIVAIEQEMLYKHDGFGQPNPKGPYSFMAKPDLVLADAEGLLTYIEYKSTSSKKDEWINSWSSQIQIHSTMKAIEASLERPVGAVIVQGLYKGYQAYGKQSSPFCYAYAKSGHAPFYKPELSYEYKAGFKRTPTWELEQGIKGWVEGMPLELLASQLPQTPPIFLNEDLVLSFFKQRAIRETEIRMAMDMLNAEDDSEVKEAIMHTSFPQKFSACNPGWGKECEYRHLCFGSKGDPLSMGYQVRVTHHEPERLDQEKREK